MGFGSGYSAPIISAVDPAGEFGPINTTDIQDTILALSRLRSVKQTVNPMEACHRHFDYSSWLTYTCPRSWLLTVTNSTPLPSGELPRETYPDGTDAAGNAVSEVPQTRIITWVTPNYSNAILGLIWVQAKVSVRGRRGVPIDGCPTNPTRTKATCRSPGVCLTAFVAASSNARPSDSYVCACPTVKCLSNGNRLKILWLTIKGETWPHQIGRAIPVDLSLAP